LFSNNFIYGNCLIYINIDDYPDQHEYAEQAQKDENLDNQLYYQRPTNENVDLNLDKDEFNENKPYVEANNTNENNVSDEPDFQQRLKFLQGSYFWHKIRKNQIFVDFLLPIYFYF